MVTTVIGMGVEHATHLAMRRPPGEDHWDPTCGRAQHLIGAV